MYIPGENGDYEKQYTILRNAKLHCKIKNNTFATIYIHRLRNKVPYQQSLSIILYRVFIIFWVGSVQFFHPIPVPVFMRLLYSFGVLKLTDVCNIYNYVFVNTNSLVVYSM